MDDRAETWLARRTSRWQDWPPGQLLARKQELGVTISVVIPARNEQHTIASVVATIADALVARIPLVDELIVMDSDSTDDTGAVAARAGAAVYRTAEVLPSAGSFPGKGEALWKSLLVSTGDLIVFIDADLTLWGPHFVTGLLGPLLAEPQVQLVKGFYARLWTGDDGSASAEGGRVTELVARPLISLWWPQLSGVVQPLAGEWAARRTLLESLPIPVGYGVELATLIDTAAAHGLDAVAQVDLDSRAHRHQANHDLALMAAELLLVADRRRPPAPGQPAPAAAASLRQFARDDAGHVHPVTRQVPVTERPPAASFTGQRMTRRSGARRRHHPLRHLIRPGSLRWARLATKSGIEAMLPAARGRRAGPLTAGCRFTFPGGVPGRKKPGLICRDRHVPEDGDGGDGVTTRIENSASSPSPMGSAPSARLVSSGRAPLTQRPAPGRGGDGPHGCRTVRPTCGAPTSAG